MSIISTEIWSDLHHDIKTDVQGSIKKVVNIDAVKTSIHNILSTPKGTRVMLRDFGSDLKSLLFENMDETLYDLVEDEIKNAIATWDDRVIVKRVEFTTRADKNQLDIILHFAVRGYSDIFSIPVTI